MKTSVLKMLIGVAVLTGAIAVAFGDETAAPEQAGARHHGGFWGVRHDLIEKVRNSDAGKAEIERFKTEMQGIHTERKTLHEAIKKDIQGGKAPKDAFEAHKTELEALIKKSMTAFIDHREKMLEIAKTLLGDEADKIFNRLEQRMLEHKQPAAATTPKT